MTALLLRDLRRAVAGGGAVFPVAFFLLVAILFPFGIGPDRALLARAGSGIIWAAALLAALLPVERLVAPDREAGVIDQLRARGVSLALVGAVRMAAHWVSFGPPMMLAALVAGGLLGISAADLSMIELSLLIGTPGLAALAVGTAALVAGLRSAGAVGGLVMLPLGVPLVIFGAGVTAGGPGALKLLGAVTLLLLAGTPFLWSAAIRAGNE